MTSATLASEFVTDTMGLVLRIEQRRLPPPVKAIFDAAESGNATVNMNKNGESPDRIPRGISNLCPNCQTSVVPENVVVGWNKGATYETPLGSAVWITCRVCTKHLKSVSPIYPAKSMDDALR